MSKKPLHKTNNNVTKQITVFLNGNDIIPSKTIKVTSYKNQIWEHVLTDITKKVKPYFGAVRKLYTSESGTSIRSFSELENNGTYVASDLRKYRHILPGYKSQRGRRKGQNMEHYNAGQLHFVNHLTKLADVRQDLTVIYVSVNRKPVENMQKFVFAKNELRNWSKCLSYIASTFGVQGGGVKHLCNAEGNIICGPWELQHGGFYVAVPVCDKFQKCNYNSWLATMEKMQLITPVIPKDKTMICVHGKKAVPSWKLNVKWRTYMREGLLDSAMFNQDIFKSDVIAIKYPEQIENYCNECVYYGAENALQCRTPANSKTNIDENNKELIYPE